MSAKEKMKIDYVRLVSRDFLMDIDFLSMSPQQRGIYCTLLFYLYCQDGKCEYNPSALALLCNCQSGDEFKNHWEKVSKKFQIRDGIIRHKRVTMELRRAKQFRQHQRQAGLASAAKRKPQPNVGSTTVQHRFNSVSTDVQPHKRNVTEDKISKDTNTDTRLFSPDSSSSLRTQALQFHEALIHIIRPLTQSDRTSFRNITNWLTERCQQGRFNSDIFQRVLDYAREAKKDGRKPAALFTSILKRELDYK